MIEVEFIAVGEKANTGDAILCRFTEPRSGVVRVVLVDGGFVETADAIVSHVQRHYGVSRIDLMICTHPDDDHINGLFGVLDQLSVTELLINRPGDYGHTSDDVKATKVDELIETARRNGTTVTTDSFAGDTYFNGTLMLAGPSKAYYVSLLEQQAQEARVYSRLYAALSAGAAKLRNALRPRSGDPGEGILTDKGGTTPRNNSSIITDIQVDGWRVLLTGDAGVPALEHAADLLYMKGRSESRYPDLFDIPHHGSRRNLTTEVMDRLAGPVVGQTNERCAFVSVGKEAESFPRPEISNAFTRRGYRVHATRGHAIRWSRGAPARAGWSALTPLPWLELDD